MEKITKVLVLGASGATGRLVVSQLLARGANVTAVLRSSDGLEDHTMLTKVIAPAHDLSVEAMAELVSGCDAVVSCLGHTLSFKGIYGSPRRLVTDVIKTVCQAISLSAESGHVDHHTKVILMNTTGNSNRDIPEVPPMSQRIVVGLLRVLLPPHVDNEKAADYLRIHVGQDHAHIEWVAVRPDALTDEAEISAYDVYPSPIRNAIFDSGTTSRINVAAFMNELVVNADLWQQWRGQMPVVYNG